MSLESQMFSVDNFVFRVEDASIHGRTQSIYE